MSFFVSILQLIVTLVLMFEIGTTITNVFSMLIVLKRYNDALILVVFLVVIYCGVMLMLDKMYQMIKSSVSLRESIEQSVLKKLYDMQQESKEGKKEGKINE